MTDTTPLYRVLQNRISRLIPLGLSAVWVKINGNNAFNMSEILGFTFSEWEYMMDATGGITGNRIYPTKLNSLSGLFFRHVKYDTKELDDQSILLKLSFVNDMVGLQFFRLKLLI